MWAPWKAGVTRGGEDPKTPDAVAFGVPPEPCQVTGGVERDELLGEVGEFPVKSFCSESGSGSGRGVPGRARMAKEDQSIPYQKGRPLRLAFGGVL